MLRKIFALLASPLIVLGWLIQWLHGASTPEPVRRAHSHMADSQAVKKLLDAEEGKEVEVPKWTKPGPVILAPDAAMAQAAHLIFGSLTPDLSCVMPEVADWVKNMTRGEALAIRRMDRAALEDHVYARRTAPWLRPVAYNDPRRQDELDQPGYLDDLIADMAPRC
jgi:hypothetical protein